jgi:hypothetical protein
MPSSKSQRALRKERRDKKKPKSKNFRTGGRPIHFDFFCNHKDLDVQIREKLAEIEGNTDEDSQFKRGELERILSVLPTKIPSREGPSPIEGERDHYYLRFFHYLTNDLKTGVYYKEKHYNFINNRYVYIFRSWRNSDSKATLMILNYFDHGPDYPGARKPPARRRVIKHLRHMQAKRAKAEAGK